MLSVVHGPFQPDLEAAFLARLRSLASKSGKADVLVVAPSRRLADRLERLTAVEGGLALLGVRFHTFRSLALSIVDEAGLGGLTLVSDPVFHDKLVDELLARGGFFGISAAGYRPRALAASLRASIRDLIDAGVSAEEVGEHFGDGLVEDPADRARLSALLALAAAYERRLRELKLLSPSGLTRLAAERAAGSRALGEAREVLYYGFYDLTGLQLEFFEAVAERRPTTLFFPHRRGHPAFRFGEPFFEERLLARASAAVPAQGGPALGPALERLFVPDAAPAAVPAGALQTISASGARDELWACVKEIVGLVSSGFCGYDEIAVVARSLDGYRAAAAEVFEENAVPADLVSAEPVLRRPLAKAALNLLTLRRRDFPAGVVEDLLSSPFFRLGTRRWRRLVADLGIQGGFLQWRAKLEPLAASDPDARALWRLVSSWRETLGAPASSWSELSSRCEGVLREALEPEAPGPADAEVWEAVLEATRSLAFFDRLGRPPGLDEFLECLEDKLRRAARSVSSGRRGVRVLDAMDARGESFAVVFLVGLKEGLFPRQILEDPLLRDSARGALKTTAGYWISRKLAGYDEERLLFYLTAASARRRLYCVYPRSDDAGKAEVPSLYLRELCRCAGLPFGESAELRVPRQPAERLRETPLERLSPAELSLRLALDGGDAARARAALTGDAGLLEDGLEAVAGLNARGPAGAFDGLVGEPAAFMAEWRARGISPTALDLFADCPFRFFAERLLGLGVEPEATESGEFAGWARGKIYHAVLERHYGGRGLEEAIESVFAENDWKALGLYPVLWRSAKRVMSENLRAFVAWDEARLRELDLEPAWREKALSGRLPGSDGLTIAGKIDRLDLDASRKRFRVVDYKTRWWGELKSSSAGKAASLVAKGQLHQLPIYAELARQELGEGASFEGASLLSIQDSPETTGLPREHRYDAEQAAKGAKAFWESVRAQVDRIAAGRFPIRPDDGEFGRCARCPFPTVCRKGHGPSRRRAAAA